MKIRRQEPYINAESVTVDPLANVPSPDSPPGETRVSDNREELLEMGIAPDVVDRVEQLLHRNTLIMAGEALRHIFRKLGKTAAGIALQRVILGPERSMRKEAKLADCSAANLCKLEKDLRRRLAIKDGG